MRILGWLCLFALLPCVLSAQTMVEAAALTGAGASAAAGTGKATADALNRAMGSADAALRSASAKTTTLQPSSRPRGGKSAAAKLPPKPSNADFESVEPGTSKKELMAKLGKPAFSISSSEDGVLEEVFRYNTREGDQAKVRLTDGKVSKVELPGAK
jgi:hypothetical protein